MSVFTIGKLAKVCDVNIDTVRYYEKVGLLFPWGRSTSGYRLYNAHSQGILQFIRHAQHIGFSLADIKSLLILNDMPFNKCERVQKTIQEKIYLIEEKERDLQRIKDALKEVYNSCRKDQISQKTCGFLENYNQGQKT